jgi:hypothetical protein
MTIAQEPTLIVFRNGTPIFTSYGKWFHPLFELEDYLADYPIELAQHPVGRRLCGTMDQHQRIGVATQKHNGVCAQTSRRPSSHSVRI